MQRWTEVGFTEAQSERLDDLVTKDYLREEFLRFKREIVVWVVGVKAPVYAALIYLVLKLGI
jgi:hypothetical protein